MATTKDKNLNLKRPITGLHMAGYLRQLAAALEDSTKLFTAEIKIHVAPAPPEQGESK